VPIATARSMADSALNLNPQLWRFTIKAINTAYSEPERIKIMLRDGSLVQLRTAVQKFATEVAG